MVYLGCHHLETGETIIQQDFIGSKLTSNRLKKKLAWAHLTCVLWLTLRAQPPASHGTLKSWRGTNMKRLWTCLWMGLGLSGCAEYGLAEGRISGMSTRMDASDYRRLRIDITPSNASDNILPQSFWIDEEAS